MPRYKAPHIIAGIFKGLFTLLIMTICAILLWRVLFSTKIPKDIRPLLANPTLQTAYTEHNGSLTLRYQEQASITRAEGNYGYFSIESCVFIPEAEQVQILFRYNNSTIQKTAKDYGLSEIPKKSETLFDLTLVKTTDLTPSDSSDNLDATTLSSQRIAPVASARSESALYTYYRYVFDGVTVEDLTDGIYIDIYYLGDVDYTQKAYGTLCIYSSDEDWIAYKPTKADRRAMQAAQ